MSVYTYYFILTSAYDSPLGRHNCLWCLIPSSKLVEPVVQRGSFPARSLESLKADHTRFTSQGRGKLRQAKNFNNVIGEAIFDIPLDNVRNIFKKIILTIDLTNRCAYLAFTCHLGSLIDSGPSWKRPVASWTSSWPWVV